MIQFKNNMRLGKYKIDHFSDHQATFHGHFKKTFHWTTDHLAQILGALWVGDSEARSLS